MNIDALGDIGVTVEADYDLSMGYKFPWYTDKAYMIAELKPYFKLGGLLHNAFHLYFMRVHLWLDIITSQMNIFNLIFKMNIVTYEDVCASVSASNENLSVKMNIQMDFNECLFGYLPFILNFLFVDEGEDAIADIIDCEWKTYYVRTPIYN